jgi:hypothetical protein
MGKLAKFLSAQRIPLPLEQKKQMLAFDKEFEELEAQVTVLQADNLKLRAQINPLKQEIERLQAQVKKSGSSVHDNPSEYACDHCGSTQLKRTGNRPDPMFGEVGIKQPVYVCLSCGKESAFTPTS